MWNSYLCPIQVLGSTATLDHTLHTLLLRCNGRADSCYRNCMWLSPCCPLWLSSTGMIQQHCERHACHCTMVFLLVHTQRVETKRRMHFQSCSFKALQSTQCGHTLRALDCSPSGSSVHGTPQARVMEQVATFSSRGSSLPRDWTQVSCLAGGFFTTDPPGEIILLSIKQQRTVFTIQGHCRHAKGKQHIWTLSD